MEVGSNLTSAILQYEQGELDDDGTIELFQKLVDSGLAWQLQGHYGRMAHGLIIAGLVVTGDDRTEAHKREIRPAWFGGATNEEGEVYGG